MESKARRGRGKGTPKQFVTTLGDLISAVYDAVPGIGHQRLELALRLLTQSPLARHITPHLEFVP